MNKELKQVLQIDKKPLKKLYTIDFSPLVKAAKPFTATLVDTFLPGIDPDPVAVRLYYGYAAPRSAFKSVSHPVDIYQKEDNSYVILPRIKNNEKFIKELE